jgi:F0F1-type ATP synthase membrane subunit a
MSINPRNILALFDGKLVITETVMFGWIVAAIIAIAAIWMASNLQKQPTKKQVIAEFVVEFIYNMVRKTMGP